MKSKVVQKPKKEEIPEKVDKYYYMHQRKKPIVVDVEELEQMGGGELKTLNELIEKDNDRREKQRIANRKSNKKRYASFKELQANLKEMQAIKAENEKLKNIMSQEEARAEAERKAEYESETESDSGFELLLKDKDLEPLNRLLCYITGSTSSTRNGDFLKNFMEENKLKSIDEYEDEYDQRRQLQKIIDKLNLYV